MATVYKNSRIQGTASTGTYATLYNTSASATAVISTIAVCNTASTAATYRVGIMGSAGTPAASDWLVYDASVNANDTVFITAGVTLAESNFIRVSSSANTVSFSAYISEIS
jgi:hypothetical protein